MPTTDPALIGAGIKSLIATLTPSIYSERDTAFVAASDRRSWTLRGDEDIDREYTIDHVKTLEPLDFGLSTSSLYRGEISVTMGHAKMGDESVARGRRDADAAIVARGLAKAANRPSGVAMISKSGESIQEQERFWLTTQTFEVLYLGTAI